jgi:pyridinium-3,5-bisthiocarboxylic acid mononucleotide nickel chelatase
MLAYFDCFSGISGDMTLGALIGLGVPVTWLKKSLNDIPLPNFEISVTSVQRNGINANLVLVEADKDKTSRNFAEIRSLIDKSTLSEQVKSISVSMFERLAKAEAAIHGCSLEEVHFHEVGGIDAIVDIVGTALCLEYLGVKRIVASHIPLGRGFVSCRHGKLPVPVPAALAVLEGVPVYGTDIAAELVTPTGATIIATLAESFQSIPSMRIRHIGYGAGHRIHQDRPNLLRIILGTGSEEKKRFREGLAEDRISIIETNIDDMNPELFGYLMERLFEDGALDVYWIPIYMKKNRPATMLQVLCHTDRRDCLIDRILLETTSLGVRYHETRRYLLERDQLEVKTTYGNVKVKRIKDPSGNIRLVPEFEDCKKIAFESNTPLRVVYETIIRETAESG